MEASPAVCKSYHLVRFDKPVLHIAPCLGVGNVGLPENPLEPVF